MTVDQTALMAAAAALDANWNCDEEEGDRLIPYARFVILAYDAALPPLQPAAYKIRDVQDDPPEWVVRDPADAIPYLDNPEFEAVPLFEARP